MLALIPDEHHDPGRSGSASPSRCHDTAWPTPFHPSTKNETRFRAGESDDRDRHHQGSTAPAGTATGNPIGADRRLNTPATPGLRARRLDCALPLTRPVRAHAPGQRPHARGRRIAS
jgi:hypothetical protein